MSDCKHRLQIADDFGDNHATMRCQLHEGHYGMHEEVYDAGNVLVQWDSDALGARQEEEE